MKMAGLPESGSKYGELITFEEETIPQITSIR